MALYEKLEYELEFITPAFIGGAFPDEEAELRPASFIGILRWWFRNLALTVTDDIEAVAHLESELFGNQNRAGKVWVKINNSNLENKTIDLKQIKVSQSSVNECPSEKYKTKLQELINFLGTIGAKRTKGWESFKLIFNKESFPSNYSPEGFTKTLENFKKNIEDVLSYKNLS